ncbi:MAG: amidohydrolase family protein [Desulfitobacterium sp.]
MKIIDAHLHFSNRNGFKETANNISQVEFSAQGLKKEFEQAGVAAGIIMSTPSREPDKPSGSPKEFDLEDGTVEGLLSCVGVNPERLKEDYRELDFIEGELQKSRVTGIKLYPGYFPYYVYDSLYDPIYELARKYQVPVAIHCGDTQSPKGLLKYSHSLTIDELAVKQEDITFVICHMGIPWVIDAAEVIAKNHNVFGDLSGLLAGDKEHVMKMKDTRLYVEYIQQALVLSNCYDKILFGSDWPLVPIEPYVEFIKHLILEEYHEAVFYRNALKVYPKLGEIL